MPNAPTVPLQVIIGGRAAAAAEEASQLHVAIEYFQAALRLNPADVQAAAGLEQANRRLFEAKAVLPEAAPPYRAADAAEIEGRVLRCRFDQNTRGLERQSGDRTCGPRRIDGSMGGAA